MIVHSNYVSGCNSATEQGHKYHHKSRICHNSRQVACAYGSVWQTAWQSRLNTNVLLVRMQSFCPVSLSRALFLMPLPTLSRPAANNQHNSYPASVFHERPEPLCTERKTLYLCAYVASPPLSEEVKPFPSASALTLPSHMSLLLPSITASALRSLRIISV